MRLLDAQGRLRVGAVLAEHYEVIMPLGEGGFATVYSARQMPSGRLIALKVLEAVTAPSEAELYQKRFLREARLLASMNHPHIVRIYDYGIIRELARPFIAMELLDGEDLQDQLMYGGLDPDRGLRLIAQALDALGHAHHQGIIHRDLKPSNLFVVQPREPAERCIVLDFGLARTDDPDASQLSRTGTMIGTPQYLAPEMIEGKEVTPAVDVYQMGLILVETLTGRRVVEGANRVESCVKHLKRDFAIPSQLLEGPFGPIVKRALAFKPGERYPDASAMRDALVSLDEHALVGAATFESFRPLIPAKVGPISTEDIPNMGPLRPRSEPETFDDSGEAIPTIPDGIIKPISRVKTAERSLVGHRVRSNVLPRILRSPAASRSEEDPPAQLGRSTRVAIFVLVAISGLFFLLGLASLIAAWWLTH